MCPLLVVLPYTVIFFLLIASLHLHLWSPDNSWPAFTDCAETTIVRVTSSNSWVAYYCTFSLHYPPFSLSASSIHSNLHLSSPYNSWPAWRGISAVAVEQDTRPLSAVQPTSAWRTDPTQTRQLVCPELQQNPETYTQVRAHKFLKLIFLYSFTALFHKDYSLVTNGWYSPFIH